MTIWMPHRSRGDSRWEIMQEHCIKNFTQHMLWIFVRIASLRGSNKYPKHMFSGEIRIKQWLSYILFCPLRILYNDKLILKATSLGTNAIVVTRVHCIWLLFCPSLFLISPSFGASGRLSFVIRAFSAYLHLYRKTSIIRTPMTRFPWLIRTRFRVLKKFFRQLKKTNI